MQSTNSQLSIESINLVGSALVIRWQDGTENPYHPLWLRESSPHPEYRDAITQMRIPPAYLLPLDVTITGYQMQGQSLRVEFSDDHECVFDLCHLKKAAEFRRPDEGQQNRLYWDNTFQDYDVFCYSDLTKDENYLLKVMHSVTKYGFAYITGMGNDLDELDRFVRLVGPPRETNWGTITDVKNIPNPYDLTMTSRSLWPHVDNPYRLPAPGYIFMQCITNDATGGESNMVDGFNAALQLKENDASAFKTLTEMSPNFRHVEETAILEDYGPIIELNEQKEVVRIRFSNRTEQIPMLDHESLDQYYFARQLFSRLIFSEQQTLQIKLNKGDGFIWDNYRILHGRGSFDPNTGNRYMRHCYLDRDTFSSRYKCLGKKLSICSSE